MGDWDASHCLLGTVNTLPGPGRPLALEHREMFYCHLVGKKNLMHSPRPQTPEKPHGLSLWSWPPALASKEGWPFLNPSASFLCTAWPHQAQPRTYQWICQQTLGGYLVPGPVGFSGQSCPSFSMTDRTVFHSPVPHPTQEAFSLCIKRHACVWLSQLSGTSGVSRLTDSRHSGKGVPGAQLLHCLPDRGRGHP